METIHLLQRHTDEVDLGQGIDYRLQILDQEKTYLINCEDVEQRFENYIQEIAPCPPKHHRIIAINGRPVSYIAWADDIIWFDFKVLCTAPRSSNDYIYLAETCHTVFISDVMIMNEEMDNYAKRFINLIDTLYDHHVNCIIAAAELPENLYTGRLLANDFKRTISRLYEMGSRAYLSTPHLAKIPDQNL
jgi:cell division protein ZapE